MKIYPSFIGGRLVISSNTVVNNLYKFINVWVQYEQQQWETVLQTYAYLLGFVTTDVNIYSTRNNIIFVN